jgi:hypothetical protein
MLGGNSEMGSCLFAKLLSYRRAVWLSVVVAVAVCGCGHKGSGVPVHGNVSYRGTPLTRTLITFFPASGRPVGTLITDGKYAAELPPGDYVVQLTVSVDVPAGYKEGDPLPPVRYSLPAEYTTRAKSTLKATVKEGQTEPIDFDLK